MWGSLGRGEDSGDLSSFPRGSQAAPGVRPQEGTSRKRSGVALGESRQRRGKGQSLKVPFQLLQGKFAQGPQGLRRGRGAGGPMAG